MIKEFFSALGNLWDTDTIVIRIPEKSTLEKWVVRFFIVLICISFGYLWCYQSLKGGY